MGQLSMIPAVLEQHGDLNATQAAAVTSAGAVDQAAVIAAAVPVFGPIGTEFLAAFATAQANHLRAVSQQAEVYTATSLTAKAAANTYRSTEAGSAATFDAQTTAPAQAISTETVPALPSSPVAPSQYVSAADPTADDDPDATGSQAPGTAGSDRDTLSRAAGARELRPASVGMASARPIVATQASAADAPTVAAAEPDPTSIELA